jgi:uncharacterized membrane protein
MAELDPRLDGHRFVDTASGQGLRGGPGYFAVFRGSLASSAQWRAVSHVRRFIPRRIANAVGVGARALLLVNRQRGAFPGAFALLDSRFANWTPCWNPAAPAIGPAKTGSPPLVKWQDRTSRTRECRVSLRRRYPHPDGRPAPTDPRLCRPQCRRHGTRRAKLALEELKRAKGFERSVLIVIAYRNGLDRSVDAVEFLHDGDIASVALFLHSAARCR